MKSCTCCGGPGPFGPSSKAKDGLKSQCRKCLADKQKSYASRNRHIWKQWAKVNADHLRGKDKARYAADPEGEKSRVLAYQSANPDKRDYWQEKANLKRYGITPEQRASLFTHQGGKCPICQDLLTTGRTGAQVDHDHVTGQVRGLLCHQCNVMLGDFQENPEFLERALVYLAKGALDLPPTHRPPGAETPGTRVSNLWYSYGLTVEVFQQILMSQDEACAICQSHLDTSTAHVDHDHKLGRTAVRGLLCRSCNFGLGHSGEDAQALQGAIDYLQDWQVRRVS